MTVTALAIGAAPRAETGHDLWLRYAALSDAPPRAAYRQFASAIVVPLASATGDLVASESKRGLGGLLGIEIPRADRPLAAGAIVAGTPASPLIAALGWSDTLARLGDEGYVIRSATVGGVPATVIASQGEAGVLDGAFHLLRLIQTGEPLARIRCLARCRKRR